MSEISTKSVCIACGFSVDDEKVEKGDQLALMDKARLFLDNSTRLSNTTDLDYDIMAVN